MCENDFSGAITVMLGDNSASQDEPIWKFNDGGKEIFQSENSSPGTGGGGVNCGF